MKNLKKISLFVTTLTLSTIFTGNVIAKTYSEYKVGDKITYNDMEFYVIENSDTTKDSVTMLKAEPLTVDEVNEYGAEHVNKYTLSNQGTSGNYNGNGYGGMAYYSSATCGYPNSSSESRVTTGCTTNYDASDVKYAVDAWTLDKLDVSDLTKDSLGYKARLITKEELIDNLGYNQSAEGPSWLIVNPEYTPNWVHNKKYHYWTMSTYEDSDLNVWLVDTDGGLKHGSYVFNSINGSVRPVITLAKTPIEVYYNIDSKTDNNGTIEIGKKEVLEEEKVKISIMANEGYKLKSLKIYKTSDNEDVTSLVGYNSETNEFIMPEYDVTVSAEFEDIIENNETIENPNTFDNINTYVIINVLIICILVFCMVYKRKLDIK